jgi:putative ATPase
MFSSAARERLAGRAPLASRLRPATFDEVVGQRHLVAPGAPLRALVEQDRLTSAVLWGPPGSGKTTLARVVARTTAKAFVALSATGAGVADVRAVLSEACRRLGEEDRGTILFVDEVHRFNRAQQDALLPAVEDGLVVFVGATTENPYFSVSGPLLSRSTLWRLEPLSGQDVEEVLQRALERTGAGADGEALGALVALSGGDARVALGTLEVALALAGGATVTASHVEGARAGRLVRQGSDAHYDQISALIKSVRGSDPDAGLYWLARMLAGGEDPRVVARRLVVLASEDVGLADPMALVVAEAAARAVEHVGLPEARLTLAEALVYLSLAPKSNRLTVALGRAEQDVGRSGGAGVPLHLRDRHYPGAARLGHGEGYRSPHDDPGGWVDQPYRPPEAAGHVYYEPSEHGAEAELAERLRRHPPPGGGGGGGGGGRGRRGR